MNSRGCTPINPNSLTDIMPVLASIALILAIHGLLWLTGHPLVLVSLIGWVFVVPYVAIHLTSGIPDATNRIDAVRGMLPIFTWMMLTPVASEVGSHLDTAGAIVISVSAHGVVLVLEAVFYARSEEMANRRDFSVALFASVSFCYLSSSPSALALTGSPIPAILRDITYVLAFCISDMDDKIIALPTGSLRCQERNRDRHMQTAFLLAITPALGAAMGFAAVIFFGVRFWNNSFYSRRADGDGRIHPGRIDIEVHAPSASIPRRDSDSEEDEHVECRDVSESRSRLVSLRSQAQYSRYNGRLDFAGGKASNRSRYQSSIEEGVIQVAAVEGDQFDFE